MTNTVFFSWQADTKTGVGRNLIERALARATSRIGDDTAVEEAVRKLSVDRDTMNVPGSPPIADTIFQKIDKAAVFVPDLTFVGHRLDGRPTPNPNVLIEYGWALKSIGDGRIVPVMNTAFGEPDETTMPFNLRHRRNPIVYCCPPDANEGVRRQVREKLAGDLAHAIGLVLATAVPQPTAPQLFRPQPAADGPGRFRKHGETLGVWDGFVGRTSHDVFLVDAPVIWLRVMPRVAPAQNWHVTDLMNAIKKPTVAVDPLFCTEGELYFVRSGDGYGIYTPLAADASQAGQVAFVFRTGEVWGIDAYLLPAMVDKGQPVIPDVETGLARNLQAYANLLVKLGISPPFSWEAGMEDTKGRALYSKTWSPMRPRRICMEKQIITNGSYSPGDSPTNALGSFFSTLFDACGAEWSEHAPSDRGT
jgi:hypothetical protein